MDSASSVKEMTLSAGVAILAFWLSTYFGLFQRIFAFATRHHAWRELDIIFALLLCAGTWLLFLSIRRSNQLQNEVKRRKVAEEEAYASARRDSLTGLPNRLSFLEAVTDMLRTISSRNRKCAVLFIDLDGFKPINDTYGHDLGDSVLVEVARRLIDTLPNARLVARLGGDEFGVLIEFSEGDEAPTVATQSILGSLREPIRVGGTSVQVGATVGMSTGPREELGAEDIIRAADCDMYDSKKMLGVQRGYKAA